MARRTHPPSTHPPDDPAAPDGPPQFEQLSLGPTVTGPRHRTEDPYEPGTKLMIKGERGIYTYRHATISRAGLVSLHLVGEDGYRAVRPEQVVPVKKPRGGPRS